MLGATFVIAGLIAATIEYRSSGGYQFAIAKASVRHASFPCFLLIFAGIWLVLEFAIARRGNPSFLSSLAERDWGPICAALVAGELFGFLMETTNAPHRFWVYTNWLFEHVAFCGVPVVVLLTWPLQYLVFVSVYSVFVSGDVWT